MTNKIKGTYISIDDSSITTKQSKVRQLVDIIQADIKGNSSTRKKYQTFVSGGTNLHAITSSLYQTVFDQNHTLQTSNPMFDMTIGLYSGGTTYSGTKTSTDSSGKDIFPSSTLMMREKNYIYKQYAQNILGSPDDAFKIPYDSADTNAQVDEAIFININRLFTRDKLSKESFALRLYKKAAIVKEDAAYAATDTSTEVEENISGSMPNVTGEDYSKIYDTGAINSKKVSPIAGDYGILYLDGADSSLNTSQVGLIYYDLGIVVLDAKKVFTSNQTLRGLIQDVETTTNNNTEPAAGQYDSMSYDIGQSVFNNAFIPNYWREASIDDIVDHICETRFGSANLTAFAFKNETVINSSLVFCRAAPSQLNFSTNPTYTDSNGNLRVITEDGDSPFSYITTIGLHSANNDLLAVAKLSRPVEKNDETDLSIRIRLDY